MKKKEIMTVRGVFREMTFAEVVQAQNRAFRNPLQGKARTNGSIQEEVERFTKYYWDRAQCILIAPRAKNTREITLAISEREKEQFPSLELYDEIIVWMDDGVVEYNLIRTSIRKDK